MYFRAAFTLLELMIVIAITAIIAAIVLPTYNVNSAKAKIGEIIPILDALTHKTMLQYSQRGSIPSSLEDISGSGEDGGYGTYVIPNLTTHLHYNSGSSWNNVGALIELSIPENIGKSIPGYVESTNGINGSYNSIAMAFYEDDGIMKVSCGRWDGSNRYIPLEYLPSACKNDNMRPNVTGNP
jgi:prepilin-type N-terminal cleavage/methylation domain-containing protein